MDENLEITVIYQTSDCWRRVESGDRKLEENPNLKEERKKKLIAEKRNRVAKNSEWVDEARSSESV